MTNALAPDDGPYGIQSLGVLFSRNAGLTGPLLTPLVFNPEVGSCGVPNVESMGLWMSEPNLLLFPTYQGKNVCVCVVTISHSCPIHSCVVPYTHVLSHTLMCCL